MYEFYTSHHGHSFIENVSEKFLLKEDNQRNECRNDTIVIWHGQQPYAKNTQETKNEIYYHNIGFFLPCYGLFAL